MLQRILAAGRSSSTSLCFVALLGAGLAGCAATADQRQGNLQADAATCADFGGRYGSPQYTECMLAQQRRRDVERLESLEQTRILSDIARNSQLMTERARQDRCRRDPDRRECR
jgi:hypothetical protein